MQLRKWNLYDYLKITENYVEKVVGKLCDKVKFIHDNNFLNKNYEVRDYFILLDTLLEGSRPPPIRAREFPPYVLGSMVQHNSGKLCSLYIVYKYTAIQVLPRSSCWWKIFPLASKGSSSAMYRTRSRVWIMIYTCVRV